MSETDLRYDHEQLDNVVFQDLTDWGGETEDLAEVGSTWFDHASRPGVTGSVTEFGSDVTLGRETQEHLASEWSDRAKQAGIARIAFVSEGIKARAVSSNLDVPQEIQTFKSVEEAVAWAGN
jgi:hypothetical protein